MIDGQKITDIRTIGSMYANGNLEIEVDGKSGYRIHVSELAKTLNEFVFEEEKKKKYIYLINPTLIKNNEE
jgi:hypothetical protein